MLLYSHVTTSKLACPSCHCLLSEMSLVINQCCGSVCSRLRNVIFISTGLLAEKYFLAVTCDTVLPHNSTKKTVASCSQYKYVTGRLRRCIMEVQWRPSGLDKQQQTTQADQEDQEAA
jgi:hypothetical protein